ncbi:phage terminase large subunit family protein [Thioalkalivibrio sp. ALJ8]|uniref:phage terminase large subunit family protein n=1 Tax=Thioalkalivibrio sp. ALJ8 TaxID=1158757 RepID=UPI00035D1648|nr:terminase gpA endonuclease subunit [Thioalkalivibrio sp. ALJ8]
MATLADLQTEQARLKAEAAEAALQRAEAGALSAEDVDAAARGARTVMLRALDRLAERLADTIEDADDENRVHYLMMDAASDWLRELGQALEAEPAVVDSVARQLAAGLRPRALLTVSQWADRHRFIETGSAQPGQWNTDRTPHLREIMDSLSEHSGVRETSLMKASGVGGTEVLYNWIGYIIDHLRTRDMLLTVPTLELRDRSLNPRLRKLFRETPALTDLVSDKKRDRTNRDNLTEFGASAKLIKAGANSADSMRSDHLPYVANDEVDAFPWDVGGEGDPFTLLENRQRTYARMAKTYNVSTPTTKGESHIEDRYLAGDQRQYHVPCPHCGHPHVLEWANFRYRVAPGDEEQAGAEILDAWMVCPECEARIEESDKTDMLARGRWIPKRPSIKRHRSYHINALYSPVGLGSRWKDLAARWRAAQHDDAKLKAFINTDLGQTWEEQGEQIDDTGLLMRLEDYGVEDIPIAIITAGIDVQKDRLEASIYGWGSGEEAWAIEHIIVPGDTATDEPFEEMDAVLREYGVDAEAWDSGYNADQVYSHVRTRSWAVATKGYANDPSRPFLEDERKRRKRLRRRTRTGVHPEPVGVDNGKALLAARLKKDQAGPGYLHFTNRGGFDDEFFAQLTAEKLVPRKRRGRTKNEWVQTRTRNEALDCYILALVACRLSGRDLDQPRIGREPAREESVGQGPTPDPFSPIPFDET